MNHVRRALLALAALGPFVPVRAETVVRITNGEWPPYLSEHLPHYGLASRIVTEAFGLQGIRVQYGFFPWLRALLLASTPEWHGTAVWSKTPERERDFIFSDEVVAPEHVVFHLKEMPFKWTGFADLAHYRIGVTNGYSYGERFADAVKRWRLRVEGVASDEQNFRKLLNGRIDLFPMEKIVGWAMLRSMFPPEEVSRVTATTLPFDNPSLHLLLDRKKADSARLMAEFNQGLRKLKAGGNVDAYLKEAAQP